METKLIQKRGHPHIALQEFVKEIESHILDGWRLTETEKSQYWAKQVGRGGYSIILVKGEKEELQKEREAAEQARMQNPEELSKKADLLNFAKEHGITVPDDIKYPAQIKAYILKQQEPKQESEGPVEQPVPSFHEEEEDNQEEEDTNERDSEQQDSV